MCDVKIRIIYAEWFIAPFTLKTGIRCVSVQLHAPPPLHLSSPGTHYIGGLGSRVSLGVVEEDKPELTDV